MHGSKKLCISGVNEVKCLKFASKNIHAPATFWDTVIFSDEWKNNIFESDGWQKVWRKRNSELQTKNLTKLMLNMIEEI